VIRINAASKGNSYRFTLHRKLKEHLMSGKKFGIASGHLVIDRIEMG